MPAVRNERIELRATRSEKALLLRGATAAQIDLTTFVLRAAVPAAERAVAARSRVRFSKSDTDTILRLLDDPPAPTPAFRKAFRSRGGA